MPTAILHYPDPEKDPSEFEFHDSVETVNDVAYVDGVRHPGVTDVTVEL